MDVITAIKLYVNKMTNESGPGMKIILMDRETVSVTTICCCVCNKMYKSLSLM